MKYKLLPILLFTTITLSANDADTLLTHNMDELVIVSTPKEHIALNKQPLSSTTLGNSQIKQKNINNIKDLTAHIPGLFIPRYGSRLTSSIYLRGVGSRIGTPAVGMYVDDIPLANMSSMDQDLSDADRIDVLRGPQGTLFGRNTIGGLIRIYTKNPMNYQGTDLMLGAATYNNYRARVTHYHRPVENFAFSAGVSYEHQGGFFRDPVFSSIDVQKQMRLDHPPTKEDYFTLVLGHKLKAAPGTYTSYSNFGYMLLSEVVEKASGMPYEEFIKKHVLKPAGCYDMHIGGIYYSDKRANEVRHYTHEGDGKYVEEYTGSGRMVERCYGGTNLPLLSGAGAWCASPAEIARFVASIDGDPGVADIISNESFLQMIEYFDQNTFSLGWNDTDPAKGWNRTGTLAGTSALVRYYPDGECWIMITNTSTYRGPRFPKYTEALFKECRALYSDKLPKRNMFE